MSSCQEMIEKSKLCTLACYFKYKIRQIRKSGLLNCPLQCIDTPKSQYCIMIVNEISIF